MSLCRIETWLGRFDVSGRVVWQGMDFSNKGHSVGRKGCSGTSR